MRHETFPGAVQALLDGRAAVDAGWCQFALRDCNGRVCAVGALPIGPFFSDAFGYLVRALPREWRIAGVVDFNNAPGRTKGEILAFFDRAIDLASAEACK